MDPETKALLERSRKRRELLNQRFADMPMPKASPRKRRTPVHEDDESEKVLVVQQYNDDDSPKRQCVRGIEQQIKPDTPAIQGIQSRIKDLGQVKGIENEENSLPVPVPRKSISSPPLERKIVSVEKTASPTKSIALDVTPSSSKARKGRFAALAQNINSWEDDLTHHTAQKKEANKPVKTPTSKTGSPAKKFNETKAVQHSTPSESMKTSSVAVSSPKTYPAPPTPRSPAVNTFSRSSPLRASKVELNRSPKPFVSTCNVKLTSDSSGSYSVTKAASDEVLTSDKNEKCSVVSSKSLECLPSDIPVNAPGLHETPPCDLNKTIDEPTKKPISERFASWEKRTQTPKGRPSDEPSKRPMSAKLAHFEKQIINNTPKTGFSSSTKVERTEKQACTPVLSASVPVSSISRPKNCDPSELPISQRMSQMQEKLSNSPLLRSKKAQKEPTAYPVGARMSAWENMTTSNMVSDVKQVNPGEVNATASPQKPPAPPPAPKLTKAGLTPQKSFKDSIQERASDILSKKPKSPVAKRSSPMTTRASAKSPTKVVHSPSKLSQGTKAVQQRLIQKSQDSKTTCSTLAAQIRAARMAELDAIQNRWKNGILRDDSSSDESKPPTSDIKTKTPVGKRREESRNKAREEFTNKLSEIDFGDDSTMTNVTPKQIVSKDSVSKASSSGKTTPTQTSSIYALIKKRDEKQKEGSEKKTKVTFHDSFNESDDETMRKVPRSASLRAAQANPVEPETFKKPSTPKKDELPIPKKGEPKNQESDMASSSDITDEESVSSARNSVDIDDDDISLKGFVSEAVRRESILPPPTQRASQSSLDSYDDDIQSESSTGMDEAAYHPDNESLDDDEEENNQNNRGAVDDLLDEAMNDSSDAYDPDMDPNIVVLRKKRGAHLAHQDKEYDPDMDPNNVVLRKKRTNQSRSEPDDYDPDMDINNVVLRRKTRPGNADSPVAKKTRSHRTGRSTDEEEDDDRPYSLSAYRKSVNVNQHHMEPVVRQSKYCGRQVVEEDIPMPTTRSRQRRDDRQAVQERIKELQELVQQEQSVIMQTSNALNKCCIGNAYFAGSAEQVECNRLLLIACQKRQVYMKEIQRLKETSIINTTGSGPQGSLTISDIRLPLKKDFVKRIGTSNDNTTHFFILLIRNGCQVICTQMLSTHDSMMRGSLDFPNLIKINGITGDFNLTVDIYGMSISREMAVKDKKKKTPKKGKGYAMALESPGGPTAVRTTSFSHVADIDLTMKSLNKNSFQLDRLPHLSPLYGQIFMRLKCVMEANVEEKGFLTMFDDVSGFGAWHRRWCVLSSNKLCVWKYPDDETRKDPMTIIDLKRCVTEKVGLVPRDICARPNTFEMVTVRQPLKGEHDTLVTKTHNTMTTVRHQMSADTKEERIMWCNKINRTLANLRTWHPDALRPMKQSSSSSSYRH